MSPNPRLTASIQPPSLANASEAKNWPGYGLDYAETRYSKLTQINTSHVGELGLVWSYNLESVRGVQAAPIVVDAVMYVTGSWSIVPALDAGTGDLVWRVGSIENRNLSYTITGAPRVYNGKVTIGNGGAESGGTF